MSSPSLRGRFVWHELMTSDPESAAGFYTQAIGWEKQAWSQDASYHLFVTHGVPMAGLMLLAGEAQEMGTPPCWISYIGTPDLDETVARAQHLGANVLKEPSDIPGVGRFAVIRDPQGAVFAVFTPEQGPQEDREPAIGDFSWHELITSDWQAAFDFYHDLFGWEKTESMDMGPQGLYQMYGWKGRTLGGMFNQPAAMPGPPRWLPYIKVPDSHRAAETVRRLGGQVVNGPMEVPGGDWIAHGVDLQGVMFAVHSAKPAAKPAPPPVARKPAPKRAAAKKAAKRPAKKAARKAAKKKTAKKKVVKRKIARKKVARKRVVKKKAARKKAARKKAARRKAGRKPARKRAARRTARRTGRARRRPAARRTARARRKGAARKKR